MDDATRARFPGVPAEAGHYESYYLRAAHPSEPVGIWIRYTIHKRPGARPTGSLWFTLFDAAADAPLASKVTFPADALHTDGTDYVDIGDSSFGPTRIHGAARTERCDASWQLEPRDGEPTLWHLPRAWMYRAKLPRTKTLSPHPAARYSGKVSVNGRELELDRWPGMVGHNWGAEHAQRWIWMHGIGFDEAPERTWIDAAIGRVTVGPLTTPWIASGAISIDGVRHPLGGIERVRHTQVRESPSRCEFVLPGRGVEVRGTVGSDARNFVGWVYADPAGGEHNTVNCSISEMRLSVKREGAAELTLATSHGASYELGMHETTHGIAIQPFSDG